MFEERSNTMTVSASSAAPPVSIASIDDDSDIDPATGLPYNSAAVPAQPQSLATTPDTSSSFSSSSPSSSISSGTTRPPSAPSWLPTNEPKPVVAQNASTNATPTTEEHSKHHHHHGGGAKPTDTDPNAIDPSQLNQNQTQPPK
jgi:hypothetical protein